MSSENDWVLVIDDDEDIRDSIQSLLSFKGYRVVTAADGREGLAKMRAGSAPALVILDFMMPGMNGDEFLNAQLADPALAQVPVVLLTGAGDVRSALTAPVEIVAKPIDLQHLFDIVKRYLSTRSASR